MRDWSYEWEAKVLKKLGFIDLKQVEAAISPHDDAKLSFIAEGSRQGQINRFELMLLAALGNKYVERHSWSNEQWFLENCQKYLERFTEAGIPIGTFALN